MLTDKLDLTGKTAVITGSSQGIGEAIATIFAEYGASVVLHYHEGLEDVEKVKEKIDVHTGHIHIVSPISRNLEVLILFMMKFSST